MKSVQALPRIGAERINSIVPHVFISIYSGTADRAVIKPNELTKDILFICFDDLTEKFEDFIIFSSDQAKQIWEFVDKYKNEVDVIYANCEAGVSRSSAVAAAIALDQLDDDECFFNSRYYFPNRLVYIRMLEARGIKVDNALLDKRYTYLLGMEAS